MDETGEMGRLPASVRDRFFAAQVFVRQHQRAARWEINRILAALEGSDVPLVLLKGGAYIFAELPPSRGRLLSDVDLLVPRELLDSFEQTLKQISGEARRSWTRLTVNDNNESETEGERDDRN